MKAYNLEFFSKTNWVFVLVKDNKIIYRSKKQGLVPLVFCLRNKKSDLKGAIACDNIIGRAAALLLILGKVKEVITPAITKEALALLQKEKIKVQSGRQIKMVLNMKGDGPCPMEKLSRGKNPKEFFGALIKR